MKKLMLITFVIFLGACQQSSIEAIIDIKSIVGKNQSEVEKILGTAEKTEKLIVNGQSCDNVYYQYGEIEIVYINDKADWITIYMTSAYEMTRSAIQLLDLPYKKPSYFNPESAIRWEYYEGIKEISFFPGLEGKIFFIYIKAFTK